MKYIRKKWKPPADVPGFLVVMTTLFLAVFGLLLFGVILVVLF